MTPYQTLPPLVKGWRRETRKKVHGNLSKIGAFDYGVPFVSKLT
jgi:hypothetical protein